MPLTEDRIRACSDEELFELISSELRERLPDSPSYDFDLFMAKLRQLPIGLRAMAATYELDVSMCLEDFCWHFRKWSDPAYCEETLRGLRELGASEEADLFAKAHEVIQPFLDKIDALDWDDFCAWYPNSEIAKALEPLNTRMWALCADARRDKFGLFKYWLSYARQYPRRVQ